MSTARYLNPKWNECVDELTKVWDALGPDRTLAGLKVLKASEVTPDGLLVLEIAPREAGAA